MSVRSVFPSRAMIQSATPADRTSRRSSSVVLAHACERARACVCVREKRPAKKRVGTLNKNNCTTALHARAEATAGGGSGVRDPAQ